MECQGQPADLVMSEADFGPTGARLGPHLGPTEPPWGGCRTDFDRLRADLAPTWDRVRAGFWPTLGWPTLS